MYDAKNNNPKTKPGKTRINQQIPDKPDKPAYPAQPLEPQQHIKNLQ